MITSTLRAYFVLLLKCFHSERISITNPLCICFMKYYSDQFWGEILLTEMHHICWPWLMLIHFNRNGKSLHLTIQRHQMNAITFTILLLVLSTQEKVHVSFCPYLGKLKKQEVGPVSLNRWSRAVTLLTRTVNSLFLTMGSSLVIWAMKFSCMLLHIYYMNICTD